MITYMCVRFLNVYDYDRCIYPRIYIYMNVCKWLWLYNIYILLEYDYG
jgi:hypothetical protein